MNKRLLILGLLFGLISGPLFSTEDGSEAWSGQILSRLLEDVGDELDQQAQKLTSSIFELITDIELYEFNQNDFSVGFEIQRKVFDNHNIINSFTVIDSFRIPIGLPVPILSNTISGGIGNVRLHLGTTLTVSSMNIRQVLPSDVANLDRLSTQNEINDVISHIKDDESFSIDHKDPYAISEDELTQEDKDIQAQTEKLFKWKTENVLRRARYSHIFNLLTQPFKLPLTNRALRKMDVGEISSYKLAGSVQLGATVGFSGIDLLGPANVIAGLGLTTYLHGDFKISVLKESETKVHLKLTKGKTKGFAGNIGIGSKDVVIFGGFMIAGKEIGELKQTIIPFNLRVHKSMAKSFDIGYRYDLTNKRAKKAYFKAVFGKLKDSESLALKKDGVTKVYTRDQVTNTQSRNHSIKLSYLYQRGHDTTTSTSSATITLDGKDHHIFQAINSNSRGYSTIWGGRESRRYNFVTTIDDEVRRRDDEKGILLKVEGSFNDKHTSAKEMRSYISEVVTMTGIEDFLVKFPNFDPNIDCEALKMELPENNDCTRQIKKARYGKSEFYYRLNFTKKQVEKFAYYDDDKMWNILETAYGIKNSAWSTAGRRMKRTFLNVWANILNGPLALFDVNLSSGSKLPSARRFLKNWRSLKTIKDSEKLSKKIAKLFNTKKYSFQFLKAIKLTLENEKIAYFVTAKAKKLFGSISRSGEVVEDLDTVTTRAANLIDFDRNGSQANFNSNAIVEGFNAIQKSNKEIVITFALKKVPRFLFFRVDRTSSWRRFKHLGKFILSNKNGRFVKGENKITIKIDGTDEISKKVATKIFESKVVTFLAAVTYEDAAWGRVSSKRLRIRNVDDDQSSNTQDDSIVLNR
ncbi:MAG: hypothetical protein HN576_08265 [Bacteriovoracaceae bacterium]|jgi:hypothetical protein|nr:hypothetical protein [Bacteriovoracaceae bacterium]